MVLGAGYWLISPFWRTEKVFEALPTPASNVGPETANEVVEIKTGAFAGFDSLHTGSGTARLIKIGDKNYIRFEEDFTVQNGPDLYVGLGENGKYIKGSELAALKGNVGSQNYELPPGMNPENIKEIWIWCRAFSVPFARAELN